MLAASFSLFSAACASFSMNCRDLHLPGGVVGDGAVFGDGAVVEDGPAKLAAIACVVIGAWVMGTWSGAARCAPKRAALSSIHPARPLATRASCSATRALIALAPALESLVDDAGADSEDAGIDGGGASCGG